MRTTCSIWKKTGPLFIVEGIDMVFDYPLCPFCSWSRLIHSSRYEGGVLQLREFEIEPSDFDIAQFRKERGGHGRGRRDSEDSRLFLSWV